MKFRKLALGGGYKSMDRFLIWPRPDRGYKAIDMEKGRVSDARTLYDARTWCENLMAIERQRQSLEDGTPGQA
jgi:hypothetical protein